jgi:CTP:molybdopterin cytidylyltransferase MocA
MQPAEVALVVLAAGRGQRMGGVAKALLQIAGQSYLARIVASARAAGVAQAVVVLGAPHGHAVGAEARRLGLHTVENPCPERGMASSIECGFVWAARTTCAGALLWPCDHPLVQPTTVAALIEEWNDALGRGVTDVAAAVPTVAGRGGHPALMGRALFGPLSSCAALPMGARSVLRASAVRRVPVADAGCVVDVDESAIADAVASGGAS